MTLASRILMAVAVALLLAGLALAIAQPGSLGDDDSAQADATTTSTTSSATTSTTTTTSTTSTSSTSIPGGTGTDGDGTDGDGTDGTGTDGGSGFGDPSPAEPSDTSDGLADTGGGSMVLAGVVAGAAGLALRRRPT